MSFFADARKLIALVVLASALLRPATAQESLADLAPFREGCQALADERFESAVAQFLICWQLLSEGEPDRPETNFIASRLLESFVKNGSSAKAVAWFLQNDSFQPSPETNYWIASAFLAEERFYEAADYFQAALSATPSPAPEAILNRAIALARSGQIEAAFELIEEKELKPSRPEIALRMAQIAAASSHYHEAVSWIASADPESEEWSKLRLPLLRLRSHLALKMGNRLRAIELVSAFLDTARDFDEARQGFLLLELTLHGEIPTTLAPHLDQWITRNDFPGREIAELYRIILLTPHAELNEALSSFAAQTKNPLLKLEAKARLGTLAKIDLEAPQELIDRLRFTTAQQAYLAGQLTKAMGEFDALAASETGETASRNLFNAALLALKSGDEHAFSQYEAALEEKNPRSGLRVNLSYLAGLYFAAQGVPSAFERLNSFILEHPDHPYNIDARLALAEIHLNQAPARPNAARKIIEGLRTRPLTLAQSERLDYVSIWIELIDKNATELVRYADEFILNWPSSEYLAEVLMILASEHYSKKNYRAAATYFARISREFPKSTFARSARFFEAKSSPTDESTVEMWRQLASSDGPYPAEAKHELGLLLLSLDRFADARVELEALLETLPPEAPLKFAVLCDLGYASYLEALAQGQNQEALERAAKHFATLSELPEAPLFWRYNAAVRRGKCLEALGQEMEALKIYRSIVDEAHSSTTILGGEETDWVFRAGFAAIEILNKKEDWATSIAVADALSEKNVPRSIEATRMAEFLRLKYWVWD